MRIPDPLPNWQAWSRGITISGLNLGVGEVMYLRWMGDEVLGSGNRDEFALDNITLMSVPAPGTLVLLAFVAATSRRRRRV